MPEDVNNTARTQRRGFQPGNPGRPKGSRNKRTLLAEKIMAEDLEGVARAVVQAARNGDMAAARIILDRLAPVRRGRPVQFDLPDGNNAESLSVAFGAVLRAVAAGEITPEEGAAVATVLEARRRAIETADLEARIAAVEARTMQ